MIFPFEDWQHVVNEWNSSVVMWIDTLIITMLD